MENAKIIEVGGVWREKPGKAGKSRDKEAIMGILGETAEANSGGF